VRSFVTCTLQHNIIRVVNSRGW